MIQYRERIRKRNLQITYLKTIPFSISLHFCLVYAYSLFAALNRISAPAPLPCMSTTPLPNHLPVHINLGNAVVAASATAPSIRVVAISDTHSLTHLIPVEDIPLGDVLVHCGDFTKRGKAEEISKFDAWLGSLPHHTKLVINGTLRFALIPTLPW